MEFVNIHTRFIARMKISTPNSIHIPSFIYQIILITKKAIRYEYMYNIIYEIDFRKK